MPAKISRLRELDFLRGLAIILVLFRHQYIFDFTYYFMGWIGVDLFFVLSGFFVSGLLFKEYLKFGNVKPVNFLIRRGFKIYPVYYIFYLVYLIPILAKGNLNYGLMFADLTFVQNYVSGWGYSFDGSWSLAVEEHFYFALAIFSWVAIKNKWLKLEIENTKKGLGKIEIIIILVMIVCLGLRVVTNLFYPEQVERNFAMTHLRIDSLLTGVFISYFFYFRIEYLKIIFEKYKISFLVIVILGLAWTPFINPVNSFFAKTIGFTLLYVSFAIVLMFFLVSENINKKLNVIFTSPIVNGVSKIGTYSYSIYIIHGFINYAFAEVQNRYGFYNNYYLNFIITTLLSVVVGMLMTKLVESYFLNLRDKYFPNRI